MGRLTQADRLLPVEKPERRLDLDRRLEGAQVARLERMEMPTGEQGIGLELTNYWRFVMFGTQDHQEGRTYAYRIAVRAIPRQKILTKSMRAHYTDQRRPGHKRYPELPGGPLQQKVEGLVIMGVIPAYEVIQPFGGERLTIEFRGGGRLVLTACPPVPSQAKEVPADLYFEWKDPPERLVFLPGETPLRPKPILIG